MYSQTPALAISPAVVANWRQTGAGAALAVSLDEVKTFVNRPIEDDFWDDEYTRFIKTATYEIERVCQIDITAKTWVGTLPAFWDRIHLTKRPFVEVTGMQYVEPTGTISTVTPTLYHALPAPQATGMVFRGDGLSWPAAARRQDAVRITVKSGFGLSDEEVDAGHPALPDEIRHALLMTIASLETKRGDDGGGGGGNVTVYAMKNARGGSLLPPEAKSLLMHHTYRWITV